MKRKAVIPLVLGLAIGLVTVKFLVDAIQNARAENQASDVVSVVRTRMDIDAFTMITPEMVQVVEVPDNSLIPATERIATIEEVEGRVTGKSIPEGAPVWRSMLAEEGTPAGLVGRIPPGFRAVSVKIDEVTSVAYQLKPGDWVDVIVVMDVEGAHRGARKKTIAEVILQHIKVLAIGHSTTPPQQGESANVKPAKSATLLVAEYDVPKLHLASTRGKITLSMRGDDQLLLDVLPKANLDEITPGSVPPPPVVEAPPVTAMPAGATQTQEIERPDPIHQVLVYHLSTDKRVPGAIEQVFFKNAQTGKIVEVQYGPPSRAATALTADSNRDARGGSSRRGSESSD